MNATRRTVVEAGLVARAGRLWPLLTFAADCPLARNEYPRLLFTKAQLPAIKARLDKRWPSRRIRSSTTEPSRRLSLLQPGLRPRRDGLLGRPRRPLVEVNDSLTSGTVDAEAFAGTTCDATQIGRQTRDY